jgi:hypothetical protein
MMLAVQYLEPSPDVATLTGADVRTRLQAACERLPIAWVILGWDLPHELIEACAQATIRANAQLYLWHPLLTGHGTFDPRSEWQTIGLSGEPVPGHNGLPEFTFICPNRSAASEAILEHVRRVVRHSPYQGMFLDRIRYPSPTDDPDRFLACFCSECHRAATTQGFDLAAAQHKIQSILSSPDRLRSFVQVLFDPTAEATSDDDLALLRKFLDFRMNSITRIVQAAASVARGEGLAVGLDCFSPALTYLVGQDLAALNLHCDWIKIMTYGHALGPAGLPYEFRALAKWLINRGTVTEAEALRWLSHAAHLPLPASLDALDERGLSSEALSKETQRARADVGTLLAGIELVDLEGVTRLNPTQIIADLRAFREAMPDGLLLSWDLWRILSDRLETVRSIWLGP